MLKWIFRIFAAITLLCIVAGGVFLWKVDQVRKFGSTPFAPTKEVVVEIPSGTGPRGISDKLVEGGVISDGDTFYQYVRYLRRDAGKLKSGEYLFRPGIAVTPNEIIARLLKGEVLSVKVTVPEGLRLDEQAPIFEEAGIVKAANFIKLARDEKFAKSLGIDGDSLEGYLFPDTYLVPKNATTEQVLKLMVDHFKTAWAKADAQRLPDETLTESQAVTLASIVEKETGNPEERPRISCVFHNRLKQHIKLQTDPTVIYATILATGGFDGNIHKSDLERQHPYNTYSVYGLPPGPIANAGLAALEAALHPITCDDIFFVSKNNGTHVFCPNLKCHEANVEKYQIAPHRHGGGN